MNLTIEESRRLAINMIERSLREMKQNSREYFSSIAFGYIEMALVAGILTDEEHEDYMQRRADIIDQCCSQVQT